MKIATLGMALLLGSGSLVTSSVARADVYGSVSVNIGANAPGVGIGSVDVFYDQLSPHGVWVDDGNVGQVFIPDDNNYVPYRNGRWEATDVGFVWISDEPHAWATTHYGRWYFSNEFGRWVWMPDTTWGPAWVEWNESGSDFGWAPLAPDVVVSYGYETPIDSWHYCPSQRVLDPYVTRYYQPRERVRAIHRQARPIVSYTTYNNTRVIVGPAPERLRAHRVTVRPRPVRQVAAARQLGRVQAAEARNMEQRAQQRKQQVQQQNAQRVQQRTEIRTVVQRRQPATRPEVTRPAPTPAPAPQRQPQVRPDREPDRAGRPDRAAPAPRPAVPARPTPPARPARDADRAPTPPREIRRDDNRPAPPARPARDEVRRDDNRPAPRAQQRPDRPAPEPKGDARGRDKQR